MSTLLFVTKTVLSVVGWTLLVLLFFPVRLDILWQEAVITLDLGYLFFRRRILPAEKPSAVKKNDSQQKKEDNKETSEEERISSSPAGPPVKPADSDEPSADASRKGGKKKDKDSDRTLTDTVEKILRIVRPLMKPGYWLARMLLKAVHVRDVSVVISVTGSDPASIGFRSGLHWALLGNFMQVLNSLFGKNVTYGEVTVYPCFGDAEPKKEKMSCTVSVRPVIIILLVLGFGLGYLFELIRNLLDRGGKKNVN